MKTNNINNKKHYELGYKPSHKNQNSWNWSSQGGSWGWWQTSNNWICWPPIDGWNNNPEPDSVSDGGLTFIMLGSVLLTLLIVSRFKR